ncbi:hypothetical protein ES288_D11G282600v1 [Gossypium darwinii]|uniref:Uncharacterized protein n=1 Tax=Gossypium darwinii TaxID=34276 RepID=A0A5D2AQV7_GOSDA|nr:hypothetical protein ES288_D11G282600v1 [Gossypium darwinii]
MANSGSEANDTQVQAIVKKYDILFIADEVISAFGRLGSWDNVLIYADWSRIYADWSSHGEPSSNRSRLFSKQQAWL